MDNTCAAEALLNVELAFAGLAVVTCGAGMAIASRPSAARRRALQAQTGAVGVDLISLNSPPWFMTKVEAASNRQHVIVISAIVLTPHARITSWPRRNRVIL